MNNRDQPHNGHVAVEFEIHNGRMVEHHVTHNGLTKIEYAAIQLLQGILTENKGQSDNQCITRAVKIAHMLFDKIEDTE